MMDSRQWTVLLCFAFCLCVYMRAAAAEEVMLVLHGSNVQTVCTGAVLSLLSMFVSKLSSTWHLCCGHHPVA